MFSGLHVYHPKSGILDILSEKTIFVKGQVISKCPFGFIVWTKLPTKLFLNFCPEIFCTYLGAAAAAGFLVYDITY